MRVMYVASNQKRPRNKALDSEVAECKGLWNQWRREGVSMMMIIKKVSMQKMNEGGGNQGEQ